MGQVEKGAFAVEAPPLDLPPTAAAVSRQHKRVPRWLRMSIRTATLVGLIALPTLAVKDPSFEKLTQYKYATYLPQQMQAAASFVLFTCLSPHKHGYVLSQPPLLPDLQSHRGFSILFASLGAFVVPLWIPLLGDVVIAFTAVIPSEHNEPFSPAAAAWAKYACLQQKKAMYVIYWGGVHCTPSAAAVCCGEGTAMLRTYILHVGLLSCCSWPCWDLAGVRSVPGLLKRYLHDAAVCGHRWRGVLPRRVAEPGEQMV